MKYPKNVARKSGCGISVGCRFKMNRSEYCVCGEREFTVLFLLARSLPRPKYLGLAE